MDNLNATSQTTDNTKLNDTPQVENNSEDTKVNNETKDSTISITPNEPTTDKSSSDTNTTSSDSSDITNPTGSDTKPSNENTTPNINDSSEKDKSSEDDTNKDKSDEKTKGNDTVPSTPIEIPNYIEVYDYDANGYYIGVDIADRSPLDKDVVYLLPANATKDKPPVVMDSKIPKWNGSSWDIVDKPKDIVVKEETSKKTDEVIGDLLNKIIDLEAKVSELETKASDLETKTEKLITNTEEQQIKIDKQEKEIEDLRQLVNGLIMSTLNTIPS